MRLTLQNFNISAHNSSKNPTNDEKERKTDSFLSKILSQDHEKFQKNLHDFNVTFRKSDL